MSVTENLLSIRSTLPPEVELVAISKYHPAEMIAEAYAAGQRCFGENHILEMAAKAEILPKDIKWHFTGHVQTNKIKYMASFVDTVQSVDSMRVLQQLDKHAARYDRVINCLLQLHVAQEESKFGLTPDECFSLLSTEPWKELKHIRFTGLMAMASNTEDEEQIRKEFRTVYSLFQKYKETFFADDPHFRILSEGMTQDYPIAVSEGANMVRIGSAIFGERSY
ncbi:MAG: YggS family pyridoxal phosphate-dependent enzyme [Bacteroidaceae bacterium]|nr:YggS family pyridoxal phosphate-dependent enzyme [Bacteroidaceae bacterium]